MLPAYAGMIRVPRYVRRLPIRAPRVCGDDPEIEGNTHAELEVLPAYAGMIRKATAVGPGVRGAPRVCGDDPDRVRKRGCGIWCSPRMRG